jgi:hypothetical protein
MVIPRSGEHNPGQPPLVTSQNAQIVTGDEVGQGACRACVNKRSVVATRPRAPKPPRSAPVPDPSPHTSVDTAVAALSAAC